MALAVGSRLGHYDVTALIGEGGMGQVYRARDTKLDRDVALKVLPDAFTSDPDRLARFEREAKVLASLNHPNIGHIYGLEEAEGTKALVLELVEGPTLADRIAQGPIPIDEALPIAKQIAEALEAAHEQVRAVGLHLHVGWLQVAVDDLWVGESVSTRGERGQCVGVADDLAHGRGDADGNGNRDGGLYEPGMRFVIAPR